MAVLTITGCGGSSGATTEAQKPTPRRVLYHRVANDMRDIAALAAGGCVNEQAIRRAMGRLDRDHRAIAFDEVQVHVIARRVLRQTERTLGDCP